MRAPRASRRTSEGRVGSNTCMTLCARSDSPRLRERSKESARRAPRCQSRAGSERAGDRSDAGKVTWPRAQSGTCSHSRQESTALLQRRRAATCSERERLDEGARPSQGAAERERDEERPLGKVDARRGSSARARGARAARAARLSHARSSRSEVDVQQVSTRRREEQVQCQRSGRRRRRRRSGRCFPSFSRRLLDISGRQGRRLESLERCSVRQRGEGKKRGGSPPTPRRGYLGRGRRPYHGRLDRPKSHTGPPDQAAAGGTPRRRCCEAPKREQKRKSRERIERPT